jgi:hypothetical protein
MNQHLHFLLLPVLSAIPQHVHAQQLGVVKHKPATQNKHILTLFMFSANYKFPWIQGEFVIYANEMVKNI